MTWLAVRERPVTIETVARRRQLDFALMYLTALGGGLLVAAFSWKRSWQPYIGLSTALLLIVWLAWMIRPRLGLNLTLFFALVGDASTIAWFPFNKNLSSHESIFWVSDGISTSPLELVLVVALVTVAYKRWAQNRRFFAPGELTKPLGILLATIAFGFAYGLGRGGDLRVALFEVRPLLYFPILYLLTISVCERTQHYRHLLYTALGAITLQSILSMRYGLGLSSAQLDALASLTEHGSSIGMNLLFVTLLASLAIRGCPWILRSLLLMASVPAMWVYLMSGRRVAFVALVLALGLFAVIIFWRQRRTFWLVVPIVSIIGLAYVGAFWNSTSPVGFPAQSVKTVVAPGDLSAKDQSSDDYRVVENYDLQATIRSSPLVGLGFGQRFLRPIPLPDISVFEFHEYIPHNSLLWLWIKTGAVGFLAFMYMLTTTIVTGVDRVRRQPTGIDFVVSIAGLLFVVMFAMYLFADIAWEARNSVLFGVCLALCTSGVGLDRDPVVSHRAREPLGSSSEHHASAMRTAEPVADAGGVGSVMRPAMTAANLSQLVGAMGAWLEADVDSVSAEDRYQVSALILRGDVLGIALEDVEATSGFDETDRELLGRVRAWALAEQHRRAVSARAEERKAHVAARSATRDYGVGAAPKTERETPGFGRAAVASATLAYLTWPSTTVSDGRADAEVGDSQELPRQATRRPRWLTEEAIWWAVGLVALTILIWRRVLW